MYNHPSRSGLRRRVLTKDDIHHLDALARAGVRFARKGPTLPPPWHAMHDQLPADFETPEAAEAEDDVRVKKLNAHGTPDARRLAELIKPERLAGPHPTLASSRYCRWARVRFVAGVDRWLQQHHGQPMHAVTLIPPDAFAQAGCLHAPQFRAARLRARFRKHFDLLGPNPEGGWLIGGLHASFEQGDWQETTGYQFHMHAICNEAMIPSIDALRLRPCYAKTTRLKYPIRVKAVSEVEPWVTYMAQAYWTQRNARDAVLLETRVRRRGRLPPPHHTEMLAWMDGQRFGELIMMRGGDIPPWARWHGW